MACFKIVWKQSAQKELRKLPTEAVARIVNLVEGLAQNPSPPGAKKLAGTESFYRVRTGDYRVVYNLMKDILVVEVIRVGHRKKVYRHLS
ncbi:MAG: type II toxin-antitoxin system RelE/ParE family toxin [Deltaproteobacteria bacterium]|nr:type II toxin-antitoxin system RelE/ParE family toxin [Deltaproteobacteria bacterium]